MPDPPPPVAASVAAASVEGSVAAVTTIVPCMSGWIAQW